MTDDLYAEERRRWAELLGQFERLTTTTTVLGALDIRHAYLEWRA